jgi:hypothetical protein
VYFFCRGPFLGFAVSISLPCVICSVCRAIFLCRALSLGFFRAMLLCRVLEFVLPWLPSLHGKGFFAVKRRTAKVQCTAVMNFPVVMYRSSS